MSEIKPVYQYKTAGMLINYWQDVDEEIFVKINKDQFYTTRIIYLAADYEALKADNDALRKQLPEEMQECTIQFKECDKGHGRLTATNFVQHDCDTCRIEALQKEVTHWKANHADLKERLHVATHRTDLPSDRLPLFDKMKAEIAALQKENERLDFKFKHYWGRIRKVLQRHRERDAAQAKRISEQQEDNLKQKDLILNFQNQYAKDHAEIESLRKQVETLGHKAPTASGFCSRDGGCVCGGDLPRIRESCSSWVKLASKNGE